MSQKKKKDTQYRCQISRTYIHRGAVTVAAKSITKASEKAKNIIGDVHMYADTAVEGSDKVCSIIPIK